MAREQDQHNHLSAFEAALAALRPRNDEFNRDCLIFLAGQASAQSEEDGRVRSRGTGHHGWPWPAAFVAMTTIAASLLVTLAVRPPRVVERIVEVPAAQPHSAITRQEQQDRRSPGDDDVKAPAPRRAAEPPGDWLAFFWASFDKPSSGSPAPTHASQYKRLRDLAVSRGLDAWPMSPAFAAAESGVFSRSHPVGQRKLLAEFLEKFEGDRLELPEASPESTSHPGAKS